MEFFFIINKIISSFILLQSKNKNPKWLMRHEWLMEKYVGMDKNQNEVIKMKMCKIIVNIFL